MQTIQYIAMIFSLFISFGTLCTMLYGIVKFINKPRDTMEKRVTVLEAWRGEVDISLKKGNDNFREQDIANEIVLKSVLALIEFEIQYCLTEGKPISKDLEKVKDELHGFLAKR
jgi:hypothetical protein